MIKTTMTTILFLVALLSLLAGCAAVPNIQPLPEEKIRHSDLLSFIQDGVTTREVVLEKLEAPYDKFEGERILTYLLRVDKEGVLHSNPFYLRWGPSSDIYTLVLVFDPSGVLEQHSLVGSE